MNDGEVLINLIKGHNPKICQPELWFFNFAGTYLSPVQQHLSDLYQMGFQIIQRDKTLIIYKPELWFLNFAGT